jgi:MFS family permease
MSNAIVLGQMSAEAMRVIGPTVAGVLIGTASWGLAATFEASAVLCLVAALTSTTLPAGHPRAGRPPRSPFGELSDGIAYVRANHDLKLLVVTSLAVVMAAYPYQAFLPSVADGIFDAGSGGYGVMSTVSAVGAVTAGLVTARRGVRDAWTLVSIGGAMFGVGLIGLGLAPVYGVALAVLVAIGGASLAFQTTVNSLLLARSDLEYHGRVQSLIMLGFSGFGIIALPLGVLADAVGLRATLVGMGVVALAAVGVFTLRSGEERRVDQVLDLG